MRPPEHHHRPLNAVLRESLLGTLNGRVAIAISVLCIAVAALSQPASVFGVNLPVDLRVLVLAPVFLFLLFVVWPPAPHQAGPSAIRWLFFAILFLVPAVLEVLERA